MSLSGRSGSVRLAAEALLAGLALGGVGKMAGGRDRTTTPTNKVIAVQVYNYGPGLYKCIRREEEGREKER